MNINKGTRDSIQRKIIEEYLIGNQTHPTAMDVFDYVRSVMPHVSVATVYRNLAILVDSGKIQKIDTGTRSRFDYKTEWHFHILCQNCGKIRDVEHVKIPKKYFNIPEGFELKGCNLEIIGVCPECKEKNENKSVDLYSKQLLMAIKDEKTLSCSQIAMLAGRHPQSVNGKLKSLVECGLVAVPSRGMYKITKKGLQYLMEEK